MDRKDPTTEEREAVVVPVWVTAGFPEKLSTLRHKLYVKAKQEPKFQFYALYDRIYRKDVLVAAWERVRRNGGAPGPDGVAIDHIVAEASGPAQLVDLLHEELRTKTYRTGFVRRVYIPKPDGRERPLGIPNVRDRIVQAAVVLVLEPIFEADFLDSSYGFRPRRGAHDALAAIRADIQAGRTSVYDADLEGYFDSIPHDGLMAAVRRRVVDRSVLSLVRQWLDAAVIDERNGGPPRRSRCGTPQGGVISPLLANLYLHGFDQAFHGDNGPLRFAGARLVRYADDFVVLARGEMSAVIDWVERTLGSGLGLRLHPAKTRVVDLATPGSSVDFLGFTFRFDRDLRGRDHRYLNVMPSKKSLQRGRERLRSLTSASMGAKPVRALIGDVNRYLDGWKQYFAWGYPRMAMREMNRMTRLRLSIHLKRRSQRRYRPPKDKSFYQHLADIGLRYL